MIVLVGKVTITNSSVPVKISDKISGSVTISNKVANSVKVSNQT